jgi:hypothetical protein
MPTSFTISVTKQILARAKCCGQEKNKAIGDNCAIAIALQDLFPNVFVSGNHIHPFGFGKEEISEMAISLPAIARDFIKVFDSLVAMPRVRLLLPEFEFVILIPDRLLEEINIDDIQKMGQSQNDCELLCVPENFSVVH